MTRARTWFSRQRKSTLIVSGLLGLLVLAVSFAGVAKATDHPSFCRTACHEMAPYHDAWSQGPHKDVPCVACHVDPGQVARMKHKLVALKEVGAHFSGDTSFPRATPTAVPDERCLSCHSKIEVKSPGFDHDIHAKRGSCVKCHPNAGHTVTVAALKSAGNYSGKVSVSTSDTTSTIAIVDGGKANLPGHIAVPCARCHAMATTKCSSCHKAKHPARGECSTCHQPGPAFAFTHPEKRTDCGSCHAKSAKHTPIKGECSECHRQPGVAWTFKHPGKNSDCAGCHAAPAAHKAGACSTCHTPGASWAFAHPGKSSSCTSCHTRPAKHRSGACTTCHSTGKNWSFRHPGAKANCTACHSRPSGHRSGSCSKCHSVGKNWSFRHTSSSNCAACHDRPSSHYGGGCSSCHSPSRSWKSATFRHAGIRGGEHSYRSFACVNCHPRGYSSHTCAKCHDASGGPSDD